LLSAASVIIVETVNRKKLILTLTILQVVFRFLLDSLFYGGYSFSLNMGVLGVAWSDTLASLALLITTLILIRRLAWEKLKYWKSLFSFKDWRSYLRVGAWSGLDSLVRNVAYFFMIVRLLNLLGENEIGGEERTVTILFADARNFTGISEKMNTQELVSVLNRYLSVIIKTTLQFDGMVNKFGGDSIMAVWNTPVECRGHAISATMAAIRTQQALKELPDRIKDLPRIEFGIGINTGIAVAGNMGSTDRLEYSVIGDAVNTAARLAGATPGGKVWVGPNTFDLIHDDVIATPLEPLSLRGKREVIQVYEVTDIQSLTSPEQASVLNLIPEGRG